MRRLTMCLGMLFTMASAVGCSDSDGSGGGTGGSGDQKSSSSGGTNVTGGTNATGGTSATGGSGGKGGSAFAQVGVCGQEGKATADGTTFEGYEEFYLISEEGFGSKICVVRFDAKRVGAAPAGCSDCEWTHQVEFSNPSVTTDVDGVCANSELGLTAEKIDAIVGSTAAYGFVSEFAGHNSVLMKYGEGGTTTWDAYGNATWDEAASQFRFDRRNGVCGY
jgi:hypothetical protein